MGLLAALLAGVILLVVGLALYRYFYVKCVFFLVEAFLNVVSGTAFRQRRPQATSTKSLNRTYLLVLSFKFDTLFILVLIVFFRILYVLFPLNFSPYRFPSFD